MDPFVEKRDVAKDAAIEMEAKRTLGQLQSLYYLLSVKLIALIAYPATWWLPPKIQLTILTILETLFATSIIAALLRQKKESWLILWAVMVGIPIGLAFVGVPGRQLHVVLLFLPFLMFFLYCVGLRWAVGNWMSDTSIEGEGAVEAEDSREYTSPGWMPDQKKEE